MASLVSRTHYSEQKKPILWATVEQTRRTSPDTLLYTCVHILAPNQKYRGDTSPSLPGRIPYNGDDCSTFLGKSWWIWYYLGWNNPKRPPLVLWRYLSGNWAQSCYFAACLGWPTPFATPYMVGREDKRTNNRTMFPTVKHIAAPEGPALPDEMCGEFYDQFSSVRGLLFYQKLDMLQLSYFLLGTALVLWSWTIKVLNFNKTTPAK